MVAAAAATVADQINRTPPGQQQPNTSDTKTETSVACCVRNRCAWVRTAQMIDGKGVVTDSATGMVCQLVFKVGFASPPKSSANCLSRVACG